MHAEACSRQGIPYLGVRLGYGASLPSQSHARIGLYSMMPCMAAPLPPGPRGPGPLLVPRRSLLVQPWALCPLHKGLHGLCAADPSVMADASPTLTQALALVLLLG